MNGTTLSGDGTTKDFDMGFTLIDPSHLRVIVSGALKVLNTDYVIIDGLVGKVNSPRPKVRFTVAPPNVANNVEFYRNLPISSLTQKNPEISLIEARSALLIALDRLSDLQEKSFYFGQTALLAGTAISFIAPYDGYFENIETNVNKAITTGGTITPAIEAATVTGAVVTIANSAIVGAKQSVNPSVVHASYTKFRKGQRITLTPASFATAGEVSGIIKLQPADF